MLQPYQCNLVQKSYLVRHTKEPTCCRLLGHTMAHQSGYQAHTLISVHSNSMPGMLHHRWHSEGHSRNPNTCTVLDVMPETVPGYFHEDFALKKALTR